MRNNDHTTAEHKRIADDAPRNGATTWELAGLLFGTDVFRTSKTRTTNGHGYIVGDIAKLQAWLGDDKPRGLFDACLKEAGIGIRNRGREAWIGSNGAGAHGHRERLADAIRILREHA